MAIIVLVFITFGVCVCLVVVCVVVEDNMHKLIFMVASHSLLVFVISHEANIVIHLFVPETMMEVKLIIVTIVIFREAMMIWLVYR